MNYFKRTALVAGREGMTALRSARIAVVGLGAVGSFAVESLARSAVGHLRLFDFDRIHETNMNRQLYALPETIGSSKAGLAAKRVRSINPECDVVARDFFVTADTVDDLFGEPVDFLVDAIDSVNPKTLLLAAAHARGIPVISAMGAATRTDPTAVRVGDLADTQHCPLARFMRKRLRRRGIMRGIQCVYSIEPANRPAISEETDHGPDEFVSALGKGRARRTMGSFCSIPGIFGLTCAQWAINHVLSTGRGTSHEEA